MYMGEIATAKTSALSNLLQTYLPQYSAQIAVLTNTQQVKPVQTPAQTTAAAAATTTAAAAQNAAEQNKPMSTGDKVLIGGAVVGIIGFIAMALRRK